MKTVFNSKVINDYRSHVPKGFYNAIKGHTGVDLEYSYENLFSPVTGEVVGLTTQTEMGRCIYLRDVKGTVHVFAHMSAISVSLHAKVKRDDMLGITGNTGSRTTKPHLHYEVICTSTSVQKSSPYDFIMTRKELPFKGFNRNPLKYLAQLYEEYGVIIPDAKD